MPDSWDFTQPPRAELGVHHRPLLTWLVCFFCVLFTIGFHMAQRSPSGRLGMLGQLGYLPLPEIWKGGYTALLTSVFVHGGIVHITFNLLWLFQLGRILEETMNPLKWALFFVCSAVVASGTEIAVASIAPIGASGVVYAMFGLMWAGRHKVASWREVATPNNMLVFVGWGLFCVVATWFDWLHVANAAHAGGFFFGLAMGWLFVGRRYYVASAATLTVLAFLTVASVTWLPWSKSWTLWKGDRELALANYDAAYTWYRRSLRLGADPLAVWSKIFTLEMQRGNQLGAQEALAQMIKAGGRVRVQPRVVPMNSLSPPLSRKP